LVLNAAALTRPASIVRDRRHVADGGDLEAHRLQGAERGLTLDVVKAVAAGRSDIDFIHVEPFDIDRARAGSLEPVDVMFDWGLATEPWVFVVDGEGVVTASFEGIIGADELTAAIDSL
jgi:hypothetical protein